MKKLEVEVKNQEEAERERKREAIRQRIAAAKAAAAGSSDAKTTAEAESRPSAAEVAEKPKDDTENGVAGPSRPPTNAEAAVALAEPNKTGGADGADVGVSYKTFDKEEEMVDIVALINKDLSEPYSIFTYRYFIYNWSQHTHMAMHNGKCSGVIVCKLERHRDYFRGYIAMLAVDSSLRGKGIGTCLVVLETECSNTGALRLYENLGFFRDKRLMRYYLNGGDAFRLKLWFPGVAYYN